MTSTVLEAAPSRARVAWLIPALTALAAGVVAWWASTPYIVGVFHDDGVYALLAKSIATGHGFSYLQLPGTPAATHYPPFYPLALAAIWRISPSFPENISALLALNAACIAVAAIGLQRLLRRWFGWRDESAAVVALCALLGVPILTLSGALMSESLFLAALPPVMLLTQRAVDEPGRRSALLAGVVIGALMLIRAHGLALLGAGVLLLLSRREWRHALLLGAAASVVQLPWILWCRGAGPLVAQPLNGTYGAYPEFFKEGWRDGGLPMLLATLRTNLHELWLLLGDRVWGGLGLTMGILAVSLLSALLVLGLWRSTRRAPVFGAFLVLYFGIIVVMACTPYRYAWGAWPLLVVLAVLGAEDAVSRAGRPALRWIALAAVAVPFLAIARTEIRGYRSREWEQPTRNASRPVAPVVEWIRRNTPPHAIVLGEAPEIVMLFTGRQGAPPEPFTAREYIVPLTAVDHARGLAAMLAAVPAQYLVTFNAGAQGAARASASLRAVAALPGIEMYEVVR
jgi:hypothetical protein